MGVGLSLCKTVMQASVLNPLADPFILGISSGGVLGAAFSIMLGFQMEGLMGELGVSSWVSGNRNQCSVRRMF